MHCTTEKPSSVIVALSCIALDAKKNKDMSKYDFNAICPYMISQMSMTILPGDVTCPHYPERGIIAICRAGTEQL